MCAARAAAPARRERIHLQFLWLLAFSSGLPARTWPRLGSADSVQVRGETQRDSRRCGQDQRDGGRPRQGGHAVGEGSRWRGLRLHCMEGCMC